MKLLAPDRPAGEDNTSVLEAAENAILLTAAGADVLDVADLEVRYRTVAGSHPAVRGVSFTIRRGEALGLIGESGSGKSTLALAVLQYLPPAATVRADLMAFEGRDLRGLDREELRRLRGARIAAVYQNPGAALNPRLTIGRQVAEVLERHRGRRRAQAAQDAVELLARVRIADPRSVASLHAHELSGGMQQRVVIAMALALEPSLLVLDEPTTALDAGTENEIMATLDELRRASGTSLLVISHNIHLVRRTCERVAVMRHGVIVETGTTAQVLREPRHAYTRMLVDSLPTARRVGRDGGAQDSASKPQAGLLAARGVTKRFGAQTALHGVDIEIGAGETLGLIGESGSGKSTLARIVAGLEAPSGGTVTLLGQHVGWPVERRVGEARQAVQMVFQSPDRTLNPRHRIGRILRRPLRRLSRLAGPAARQRAAALLAAVKLPPSFAARLPKTLSGGQRQRVAIARAFAGSPRLVILDEPTSALDLSVQAEVLTLLGELQRQHGTSYLLVSHDLDVVRAMADRIGVLYRGRIIESGAAEQVFAGPNHPYTLMLTAAASASDWRGGSTETSSVMVETACPFAARCPIAESRCSVSDPPEIEVEPGHLIRCWQASSSGQP